MMDEAEETYRLGQEAASHGDWSQALTCYQHAIALDGQHWKARFGCGLARQRLGENQAALADFAAVLEVRADLPEPWYSRGVSRKALNDFAGSLSDCDTALALRAEYADAQYLRCVCLKDLGRAEVALRALDALLSGHPAYIEARYVRATLTYQQQHFDAAKADLDAYLTGRPTDYSALLLRGLAAYYMKQHTDAVHFLTRAIEVEPDNGSTYGRRAVALEALGRDQEAATDFARCKSLLNPSSKLG